MVKMRLPGTTAVSRAQATELPRSAWLGGTRRAEPRTSSDARGSHALLLARESALDMGFCFIEDELVTAPRVALSAAQGGEREMGHI